MTVVCHVERAAPKYQDEVCSGELGIVPLLKSVSLLSVSSELSKIFLIVFQNARVRHFKGVSAELHPPKTPQTPIVGLPAPT